MRSSTCGASMPRINSRTAAGGVDRPSADGAAMLMPMPITAWRAPDASPKLAVSIRMPPSLR